MLDVVYAVETISQIGTFKVSMLKTIAGKMLSDPYYMPVENEMIMAAYTNEYSLAAIAKYLHKSRQYIYNVIHRCENKFAFIPKCEINEDEQLVKFLDLLDIFKKAGL